MKTILMLAFLAGATAVEAAPLSTTQVNQDQQDQPASKKDAKRARKVRRQNGPEVYKGTVANQRRVVTDAAGSEKDDNGDDSPRKAGKNPKK